MNQKIRASNIELLRIISMFIIVIYHFLAYSVIPNSPELNYITQPLITVLHIGVVCFVLISGYWGIKFSLKGFTKLFLYCSFYSILIYAVAVILNPELFSIALSIKSIIPDQWWFIPVYLCLFLIAPIINIPLNTKSYQTKLFFIIILGIISFGFGLLVPSLSTGKNPLNFVLIYYIGNYFRTELVLPKKINLKNRYINPEWFQFRTEINPDNLKIDLEMLVCLIVVRQVCNSYLQWRDQDCFAVRGQCNH